MSISYPWPRQYNSCPNQLPTVQLSDLSPPSCPNCLKCKLKNDTPQAIKDKTPSCPNCRKCTLEQQVLKDQQNIIADDQNSKCALGPSYWCASDLNFQNCHKEATLSRNDYRICNSKPTDPKPTDTKLTGAKPTDPKLTGAKLTETSEQCSVGPSQWCSSDLNFHKCHGLDKHRADYQVCKPYMTTKK